MAFWAHILWLDGVGKQSAESYVAIWRPEQLTVGRALWLQPHEGMCAWGPPWQRAQRVRGLPLLGKGQSCWEAGTGGFLSRYNAVLATNITYWKWTVSLEWSVITYHRTENSAFHRPKLDFQGSWGALSWPHFSHVPLRQSLNSVLTHRRAFLTRVRLSGPLLEAWVEKEWGHKGSVQGEGRVHRGERKQNKGNLLVLGPWHTLSFCLRTLEWGTA